VPEKTWTWPAVAAFLILAGALVGLYALANDPAHRNHILGYMDTLVPFVVGAAAGALTGFSVGYQTALRR
jgi:hypothetical protein